ncbi:MAG: M28 family peptidase, partial [Planctomycetes bacterium]|nr:M28 family peptidase [Planctomycetota bacterium]
MKLGSDFNTLAISGSGKVTAPLVFVGYGITAMDHKYDEYHGIDVKDKVVLILRKEPQQNNPHSVFDGTKASRYALFGEKVSNAYAHGAAAVILINDHYGMKRTEKGQEKAWQAAVDQLTKVRKEFVAKADPKPGEVEKYRAEVNRLAGQIQRIGNRLESDFDDVLTFRGAGTDSKRKNLPIYFAKRSAFDPMIKAAFDGMDLAALEAAIDKDLKPVSRALTDWNVVCEANVVHKRAEVKNVVGVLEGEGPLANETVILGAHYDHLGYGGRSNRIAPQTIAIHNGADDNASGTAVLLEIARSMARQPEKPK